VLNYETQSDSQYGAFGRLDVRVCFFQPTRTLQQLGPVKLDAQQGSETEKQEREERQEAGPATGTNRLLHLWMSGASQGGNSDDEAWCAAARRFSSGVSTNLQLVPLYQSYRQMLTAS
jgi:hypothetical protein